MSLPLTIEDLRALPPVVLEQYAALSPITVIGTAGGTGGVTLQQLSDAVVAHSIDPEPHPVYDDAPSFTLQFENGLV